MQRKIGWNNCSRHTPCAVRILRHTECASYVGICRPGRLSRGSAANAAARKSSMWLIQTAFTGPVIDSVAKELIIVAVTAAPRGPRLSGP